MKSAKSITLALVFTLSLAPMLSHADSTEGKTNNESSLSPEEEWENGGPSTVIYENPGHTVHVRLDDNGLFTIGGVVGGCASWHKRGSGSFMIGITTNQCGKTPTWTRLSLSTRI